MCFGSCAGCGASIGIAATIDGDDLICPKCIEIENLRELRAEVDRVVLRAKLEASSSGARPRR